MRSGISAMWLAFAALGLVSPAEAQSIESGQAEVDAQAGDLRGVKDR